MSGDGKRSGRPPVPGAKRDVVSVRLSKATRDQLEHMMKLWGENQSRTFIRALERVYTMTKENK